MKLDLHIHCKERSQCSVSAASEMIRAARSAGLQGMAFSDHDRLAPVSWLAARNQEHDPFRLFTSIEVTTTENEHVLVLGMHDPRLEQRGWSYPALRTHARRQGAYTVLAHPFRFQTPPEGVWQDPPDAIELFSSNIHDQIRPRIQQLLQETGCRPVYTSDAHHCRLIGQCWIELEEHAADDAGLLRQLHAGAYRPLQSENPGT